LALLPPLALLLLLPPLVLACWLLPPLPEPPLFLPPPLPEPWVVVVAGVSGRPDEVVGASVTAGGVGMPEE